MFFKKNKSKDSAKSLEAENKKKLPFLIYGTFFICSLLPFFLYGKEVLNSPYNNEGYNSYLQYFFTWTVENSGMFTYFYLPYNLFIGFLSHHLPQFFAINLSFSLVLFMAFVTSFKLLMFLFQSRQTAFVGSFFYVYSIYGQFIVFAGISSGSIIFATAPFFVWKCLSLKKGDDVLKEAIILSLVGVLLIAVNLTFIIYLAIFCLATLLFRFLVHEREDVLTALRTFVIFSCLFIFLESPFILSFGREYFYQSEYVKTNLVSESVDWKSSTNSLHEVFREMGSVSFYYYFPDIPAYPNAQKYIHNPIFILLSFLYPILFLLALVFPEKRMFWYRYRFFLLGTLLVSLFMALGVYKSAPTQHIYRYFAEHVPFFSIFRDAYKPMFLIHLVYVLLGCYVMSKLLKSQNVYFRKGPYVILFLVFLNSYSFWSGTFFRHELIRVPQYWYDFSSYYRSEGLGGKILFMPSMPSSVYTFTSWQGKNTVFYRPLVGYRNIANIDIAPNAGANEIFDLIHKSYTQEAFASLLGLYGVSYVLLQYDVDFAIYNAKNPEDIEPFLRNYLSHVKRFE